MRTWLSAMLGVTALQVPLVPVDVPDHATGRVIVRGEVQIVTRRLDGVFDIVLRQRLGRSWSEPTVLFTAPRGLFAQASSLSPDGQRLFFETNVRTPLVAGRDDSDAWVIERAGSAWAAPRPLGGHWATAANEHAMTTASNGTVCLNSARPGGLGENDILCSTSPDEAPDFARTLNSADQDAFPVVAAAGDVIVFASDRAGGLGGWDLYMARRAGQDWAAPVNLGASVNSPADELHPWLDGDRLAFVRTSGPTREVLMREAWQGSR